MVAIRTTAFFLELPLVRNLSLVVSDEHINFVIDEANKRLVKNFNRIDRFLLELKVQWQVCFEFAFAFALCSLLLYIRPRSALVFSLQSLSLCV
jgi:hypothetical protein